MNKDDLLKISILYADRCQGILKFAKIRKLPSGKYRVLSRTNRNLGTYSTKKGAEKRLKEVEYFKYLDTLDLKEKKEIDLSDLEESSLSAFMRELNKKADKEQVKKFLEIYKHHFDQAIKNKVKKPDMVALKHSLIKLNNIYKVKINKKITKTAALEELGDARVVGNYLANIVKFILNRISPAKRQRSIDKLKTKFYYLNENDLSTKKMPASSSMGQSITFVKTVLFNHNPKYIRDVLNNLIKYL